VDIPQWVKDFIAGTIEVTPEIVAAFREWSAMQNPVTLFSSIGTNFLSQNLARQDFEAMYGSLPPEARYEAAQAEQSRIVDLMMNPNLPQASRDAFEQQYIAAGEETTYAAINLGIYNGTIDGTDRQSVNNALFEENRFYFGDYNDYGFNSAEEYFQAVIDDPFTNPPPEDVAWLFDTYKDADGNEILVYDHVVAAAKDYDEKQAEAQAQYALEAENRANMERLYGNLEASGINPDISRGIALGGDKDAIAAQLGMGTFRTSAQQNAGVLTAPQRGYVTYGFTGDGSDGAATSDSYDYSVSTQPDLNVQRDIVPQGYQGPAGSFSVGAGSGNPLFGPNANVASHGDPNPSRNLTSGNLPMSMAQLSSGVYQSGDRSLAESKLPDMYFDLTDPDQMNSYLGNATYAGIPYDVAINQLIEHNQQYHPERFSQDQQAEDYDPFTLASDFLATATEDPNSQFNSPRATGLAENLGQYTTSVSDIVEETRVAEESTGGVAVTPVETTLESGDTALESGDTALATETADEEETVANIVESTRVDETPTGVLPVSPEEQIKLDEAADQINNLDDSGDDTVPTSTSVSRTINGPPTSEQRALAYRLFAENGDRTMLNDIIAYNTEMAGIAERAAANEEGGIASEQAGLNDSLDDERDIVRAAFEQRGHRATDEEIDQILDENPNFVNQDGVVSSNSIQTSLSGAVNQYVKDFRSPYTDFVRDQLTNLGYEASDKEIKRIIADSRWVGFGNSVDSNALERGLSTEISSFAADKGVGGKNQEDVDSERAGNEDFSLQDTVAPMWAAQDPESKFTAEPVPRINPAWNGLEEWQAQQNSVVDTTGLNVQPDGEVLPGSNVDGVTNGTTDTVTTDAVNGLTLEQVQALIDTNLLTSDDVVELIAANPQYTDEDIVQIAQGAGYTNAEIDALFEAVDTTTGNIAGDVTQLGLDVGDLSGDVTELGLDLGDLSGDLTDVQTEVSGISGIVDELQIDITDVNGRIDLVEITFQGAVDALQEQHDAEIAIINEQLANDIPALQTALDALTIQQQEDVDALTTAYTEAITAAQSETTDEFLGILENYITNENLSETLSDYVTNEGLAETLDSYVNRIEDGYNQLLEDYGDLQDQVDQASSQYEVDALATQMEQMRDEIDTYVDQTGYDPQTGTVTGGDGTGTSGDGGPTGGGDNFEDTDPNAGGGTTGGGTPPNGGPYSDNPPPDDLDPNAGGGTTGGGTPPNGGPTGGGDNFEDTDPNAGGGTTGGPGPGGGGDGGGGEDWDPTLGRTYPGPQPGGGIGSGFLGNQYPPRQYQNQGYDPYTRPGPPAPLTGLTALTQPYNRPRQGEPVNPQYNPTYNYPYPPLNNKGEDDETLYDEYGQPIMGGYNQGGQIQPITDMSMNDMLQNQGIGSLTNYETNVAPFQNAFRPNVRRYN